MSASRVSKNSDALQSGRGIEEAIRRQLGAGHGILKVANMVGCGSGTVQRVKREMVATMAEAA